MIRRHEPFQHQRHELGGLDRLTVFLRKDLCVDEEIAMDSGREFDSDLDRPIVRKGGKFQLGHRIPQLW
jgi:hypothetical protein